MIDMEIRQTPVRKAGRPRSFDRDEALHKAMLTFWRYGYETTSISALTEAMGVTAPSLYAAFGDKKQLFLEAMHLYAGSPDAFAATLRESRTAHEAVYRMLMSATEGFTNAGMPRGCLLASATASGSEESREVQKAVSEVRRQMINRVRSRIEDDIASSVLPADTQAQPLASMAIALVQGLSVLARDGGRRKELKAMVTMAMTAWPRAQEP